MVKRYTYVWVNVEYSNATKNFWLSSLYAGLLGPNLGQKWIL